MYYNISTIGVKAKAGISDELLRSVSMTYDGTAVMIDTSCVLNQARSFTADVTAMSILANTASKLSF